MIHIFGEVATCMDYLKTMRSNDGWLIGDSGLKQYEIPLFFDRVHTVANLPAG